MTNRRKWTLFVVPVLLGLSGTLWLVAATEHFETMTGRAFYGLAAVHYSSPEWRMEYQPGGQHIQRWTVTIPPAVTLLALLTSAAAFTLALRRQSRWAVATVWALHIVVATLHALVAAWYSLNVMGVFI